MLDRAPAIDQNADLTTNLVADLAEVASELIAEHPIGGDPAPEEALDLADLAGFETVGVAVDLDGPDLAQKGEGCVGSPRGRLRSAAADWRTL